MCTLSKVRLGLLIGCLWAPVTLISTRCATADQVVQAEVIIAGGSTAALAAAFAAAEEGATTVLLEPTDWIGGQLTSSGVSAVDEAWHRIEAETGLLNVAKIARDPRNMTPWFRDVLLEIGNPGRGWVSRFCFEPKTILDDYFVPRAEALSDHLTVYRETVIKRLQLTTGQEGRIMGLTAIQRTPRDHLSADGYDRLPSLDVADWYSTADSERFTKRTLRFEAPSGKSAVFIDATEWGELLALSGKRYLQGVDVEEGSLETVDTCGQATVFGFVQELCEATCSDPAPPAAANRLGFGKYEGRADAWSQIWTYRRIKGSAASPATGDLSLQNWGFSLKTNNGGNDYPFGYLFLSKRATAAQLGDWRGGVDLKVMAAAERHAFGWHHWFRSQAPSPFKPDRIRLRPDVLGTGHGLSKLPYIRDARRSIGMRGFIMRLSDLTGEAGSTTAKRFPDRVAIGCYPADVHHLATCTYPPHAVEHYDTRPFYIPYRALTHEAIPNLLVAGKTMAQSFMANSATRLHPIEWSTGTAAGTIAALAYRQQASIHALAEKISEVQAAVASRTPIEWQIE